MVRGVVEYVTLLHLGLWLMDGQLAICAGQGIGCVVLLGAVAADLLPILAAALGPALALASLAEVLLGVAHVIGSARASA